MDKIAFSLTTSKWLEAFKANQTFALNQTMRADFPFQATSQEILLNLYEHWFTWLLTIEKQLSTSGTFDEETRTALVKATMDVQAQYQSAVAQHSLMDSKVKLLWARVYKPAHDAYVAYVATLALGQDVGVVYSQLAERLLSFMQHTLFALHEVDDLLYNPKKTSFISVDDYVCDVYNQQGKDLLGERVRLYKSTQGASQEATWKVKSYTDCHVPEGLRTQLRSHLPEAHL